MLTNSPAVVTPSKSKSALSSVFDQHPARFALGLTALGLGLRLLGLGARPLWFDEAISAIYARQDFGTLLRLNAGDNHPPGYYLLLKLWSGLFGDSEGVLRLLSVWPGTISVWLVWCIGQRLLPRLPRAVLVATALMALSPFQIYFSQEVRNYSTLELAVLAATLAWLRALETNRWRDWLLMALAGTFGLVCNFTTAFYLLALGLYPFFSWRYYWQRGLLPRLVLTGGVTGLVSGLLLWPKLTGRLDTIKGNFWIPPPDLLVVLRTFYTFVFGAVQADRFVLAFGLALVLLGLVGVQVGLALPSAGWLREGLGRTLWLLVGPMLLIIAVSWAFQPLYLDKALIACAPYYYLLIGWAIFRPRPPARAGGWLLVAAPTVLALGLALVALPDLLSGTIQPLYIARYDAPRVNRYLAERARPGDRVVTATDVSWLPLVYYNPNLSPPKYPLKEYPYPNIFPALVERLDSRFVPEVEVVGPGSRTWVVFEVNRPEAELNNPPVAAKLDTEPAWFHSPDWQRETLKWFDSRYRRVEAVLLDRLLLVLYEPR